MTEAPSHQPTSPVKPDDQMIHRVSGQIQAPPTPPRKCRIASIYHRVVWLAGLALAGIGVATAHSTGGWGAIALAFYIGPKVAGAFLATTLIAYFVVRKKVPELERQFLVISAVASPALTCFLVAAYTLLFGSLSDC